MTKSIDKLLSALQSGDIDQHAAPDLFKVRDELRMLNALYLCVEKYMENSTSGQPIDPKYWVAVLEQYKVIEKEMGDE